MPFPTHLPRLRATLLAIALAAALPAVAHAADLDALPDRTERTDLPAGPLGRSLGAFASRHGVALSFDPALTEGLQAPALQGEYSARSGFERLLAGSGLRLLPRADGSYTLVRAPAAGSGAIAMPSLRIGGQRTFPYSEGMVLDEDYIQSQAKGNGDIATLLRINPAVQFSDTSRTSRNMGEIRPADFSINGAPYYQNLFLLDGVSFNNDIDPAFNVNASSSTANANHFSDVPSSSQGIALDTDLIGSLAVYDSNIPAAYGGFNGGVVEATSRKAGDAFSGKLWFRMARSAWDEVIVPTGQETTFEQSATYAYQPHYDKYKVGMRLEGRTPGGLGIVGSLIRTRSDIPLRGYTAGNVSSTDSVVKEQTRENTAATLALDWTNDDGLELGANVSYAPTDDRYFIQNANNAWFDLKSGGPVLGLRAIVQQGAWTFRNILSYSDLDSSRRSQVPYWKAWAKSELHDWGVNNSSFEGSWGNVDQHDRKFGYALTIERDSFDVGPTEHNLRFGTSYQHREANYHRLNDHHSYLQPYATTSCTLSDGTLDDDGCSLSPVLTTTGNLIAGQGQYFRRLTTYRAGEFSVSGDEWSAWAEDDIRVGDWSFRPGVRIDGNSIWDKTSVSPRMALSWDVLGNGDSVATAGINRYYGRNFFSYLLREGRERLTLVQERRSSDVPWDAVEASTNTTQNRITDVDIPYSNEWTLGLSQRVAGLELALKYVNRENRDEVLRQSVRSNDDTGYYSSNVYEYTNNGRSSSDTYSLTIGLQQPWQWRAIRSWATLSFDHTDVRRNYNTYQTEWSDSAFNELVRYKGDIVRKYDMPAGDYNRPWTARLSTHARWDGLGLMWSNFLRYRSGFRDTALVGEEEYEGQVIDVYDDVDYPKAWTWDSTVEYALTLPRDQEAYVRIEATNLLNRSNHIVGNTVSSAYYEPGRSYWLEVGYRF